MISSQYVMSYDVTGDHMTQIQSCQPGSIYMYTYMKKKYDAMSSIGEEEGL